MTARVILALVDIDHRENAVALCREALAQTSQQDVLHVAYVMPYGHFSYIAPYISEESIKAAAEQAHADLSAICQEAGLSEASEHVLRGGVGEQALLLVKQVGADLILVNARRPEVKTDTLGAQAAQIIRHAPCSVLIRR